MDNYYECRYCGQRIVKHPDKPGPAELYCSCNEAKAYQERIKREQAAEDKIMMLFYGDGTKTIYGRHALPKEFILLLRTIAQGIMDEVCQSANIKYDKRTSCRMKIGANQRLVITRKDIYEEEETE